jgi:protein-disulfide isomerase
MRRRRRSVLTAAATAVLACVGAAPAAAAITPTRDATAIARAIADDPTLPVSAEFTTLPPNGNPAAISTTPLGEFPTSGDSYGILSTGDATVAANPNGSGETGSENGGPPLRGRAT